MAWGRRPSWVDAILSLSDGGNETGSHFLYVGFSFSQVIIVHLHSCVWFQSCRGPTLMYVWKQPSTWAYAGMIYDGYLANQSHKNGSLHNQNDLHKVLCSNLEPWSPRHIQPTGFKMKTEDFSTDSGLVLAGTFPSSLLPCLPSVSHWLSLSVPFTFRSLLNQRFFQGKFHFPFHSATEHTSPALPFPWARFSSTLFCFTVNFLKPRATPCFSFTSSVLIQCLAHGRFNKYFERDN